MGAYILKWAAAIALLAAISSPAGAQVTDLRLANDRANYGSGIVKVVLQYRSAACPFMPDRLLGSVHGWLDGVPVNAVGGWFSAESSCVGGVGTAVGFVGLGQQDMGVHSLVLRYTGNGGDLAPTQTGPMPIRVVGQYEGTVAGLLSMISLGIKPAGFISSDPASRWVDFSLVPNAHVPPPPPLRTFRFGFVNFSMKTIPSCGFATPCSPQRTQQDMQLEFPDALPAGSTIWAYLPTNDDPSPSWRALPARIEGRLATFTVTGGWLFTINPFDVILRGSVGVSVPTTLVGETKNLQDMWWGGPGENGWGVSVVQSDDRLFLTFHVYDPQGQPTFYVMRDGSWDATRTVFSGALYHPNARTMGGPIGSASVTFDGTEAATLRYTLAAGEGAKSLQRMAFGPAVAQRDAQAGLWDLVGAGTGAMTISKQGEALFITWLEFPGGGAGQWMVAPAGQWIAADTFEAPLFRTMGAQWAGVEYSAARLNSRHVGSVKVRFIGNDDGEVTYTIDGVTQSGQIKRHAF